jgi:transcriptional regulator with XRE-family HTH domain
MSSKGKPRPITGAAVRAYRRELGLNQKQFAETLGVSQGAISLWEAGRIEIGKQSQQRLLEVFDDRRHDPQLGAFLKRFERERGCQTPLATNPLMRSITMTVWKWNDQFDLGPSQSGLEPCGMVTVCIDELGPAVAIEMPAAGRSERGDIVVFTRTDDTAPSSTGRWLVQQGRGHGASQVLVLEVKRGGSSPPRSTVLFPKGAAYQPSTVDAVFRAVFEGRYL